MSQVHDAWSGIDQTQMSCPNCGGHDTRSRSSNYSNPPTAVCNDCGHTGHVTSFASGFNDRRAGSDRRGSQFERDQHDRNHDSMTDREIGNTDRRRPQEMERNGTIPGAGWES